MAIRPTLLATSVAASIAALAALPAYAQSGTQSTSEQESTSTPGQASKNVGKVKVVGSRISRATVEGPSPVTILTSDDISKQGYNTVREALQNVSMNTGFGQNDFNANGGFTPNASVVNLRGLGPGRTLLLINGRRANDYPFPYNGRSNFQNFNNLPSAAIERIEILSGGASAIYGSDAVAGVMNVVLKTNFDANSIKARATTSTDGGRNTLDVQYVGGKSFDRGSLTWAVQSYNADPLFAWEREEFDSAADNPAPPGTFPLVPGNGVGGYQPPIGIQLRRITATGATGGYIMPTGRDCSADSLYRQWNYTSSSTGNTLGPACGYDRYVAEQTVANGTRDLSGYLHGRFRFTDNVEGWASVQAFQSKGKLGGGVEQWFGGPQPNGQIYDPNLKMRLFPIRAITPASYGGSEGTFQKFNERSVDLSMGLSGTLWDRFDWDWQIGGAQYKAIRDRPRMTVQGATDYFLGPRLGTTTATTNPGVVGAGIPIYALNLDRFYGPISAEDYAKMSTMVHYDGNSQNASTSFSISGDMFKMPGGTAGFAAVVEASHQEYKLESDRRIFPDVREIYNLTGTGGGGKRNRYALGTEFKFPLATFLTLNLAGRIDKYDDITEVNDAKTWGAGIEFRPFKNLLIRGNYSTSFKAPDMHYVFSERSGSFGSITDYYKCVQNGILTAVACQSAGGAYNYQAFTTSQGQPGLREETGSSWTAGFVWDVYSDLSLSLDYYDIRLKDVVSVQSGASILEADLGCRTGKYANGTAYPYALDSQFCQNTLPRVERDPITGNISEIRSGPINLAFMGTRGLDGRINYRKRTENWGTFSGSLQWTHVLDQTQKLTPIAQVDHYRDWNSNWDQRSMVSLSTSWTKSGWQANWGVTRRGSSPIWDPTVIAVAGNPYGFSGRGKPFIRHNMSVSRDITDNLRVRLLVNNVFDNHGVKDPTYYSYPYQYYFYDMIGRTVGLEANYRF